MGNQEGCTLTTTTERAVERRLRQSEAVGARRYVRVCREHDLLLDQDGTGRLRCPRGHAITPYRGGWSVVDMRSGVVVASATTEQIELTEGLLHEALRFCQGLRETTEYARRRRMVATS
jgi:hypothetical protein